MHPFGPLQKTISLTRKTKETFSNTANSLQNKNIFFMPFLFIFHNLIIYAHLMTTIVLLVTCGMLENLKAVLAQEVAGILMPSTKVVKHIRVGGGAVFTHLKVLRHYRHS